MSHSLNVDEGYVIKFDNGMYGSYEQVGNYDVDITLHEKIEEAEIFYSEEGLKEFIDKYLGHEPVNAWNRTVKKLDKVKYKTKVKVKKTTIILMEVFEESEI